MTRKILVVEDVTFSEIEPEVSVIDCIRLAKSRNLKIMPLHTAKMDAAFEVENVPIQRACINGQEFEYAVTGETKKKLWFIFKQIDTLKSDNEVIRRDLQSAKNIIKDCRLQERLIRGANFLQRLYYLFTGKLP